jgi:hypothetical protein
MKTEKTLYLVYDAKHGVSEEEVTHLSDAISKAKHLAEMHPNNSFYVLKSITGFRTAPPEVQELQFRDAPDNGSSTITRMMEESQCENS